MTAVVKDQESIAIRPKILVVDDQEKNLFSMNTILKSVDVEVHLAQSGREAISKILRNDYALILLDVQMPEIDGFDTAQLIRSNEESSNTPIIFVTAYYSDKSNVQKGYDAGGVEYMCKPIDSQILLSKVKIFLDLYLEKHRTEVLNHELAESNQQLLEFARIASHDLKEPLRGIISNAELLQMDMDEKLTETDNGKLDKIINLGERLQGLISSLFQYSQIGQVNAGKIEIDVNVLVDEIVESLHKLLEEKNAKVTVEPNMPSIIENRTKVGEIFRNLISNALKYNESDPAVIEVGCRLSKQNIPEYFVRDNGIGISEKHQEKIFHIFRRLHGEGKYGGGTGAGLSIVKRTVEMCGGRIWLESKEGEGSTFYFTLAE